ncbi:MAG: BNR-4 repeat-containing protein [Limnochordales bacterium]|nr:BNR-4 repeat-containing protein [Limnochordales bacterium]
MMHRWLGVLVLAMTALGGGYAPAARAAQEVGKSADVPIVLKPWQHEEAQFGYRPWYTQNEPSFDRYNRPYIRSRGADLHETGFIHTLRGGKWVAKDFTRAIRQAFPKFDGFVRGAGSTGSRVVFDADDHLYTLLTIKESDGRQHNILLYSTDYGDTFQVYELPPGEFAIEYWVGHNTLNRPPLIGLYQMRASHPAQYADYYNFFIIQPEKRDGKLVIREPILVTENALPPSRHSGEPSFAVSSGNRTFFTWAEITEEAVPGVPTFVATYYADTNTLGKKHLVAYGPPVNDSHNTPGICIDSKGILHLISGSHGDNFYYSRSLKPYTADEGWTDPVPVLNTGWRDGKGERGRQTYLAFVCDGEDTLHIAFRQWRQGVDPFFGGQYYGALAYQRKPAGGTWSEPTVLVVPPVQGYSIYYHKLSLDRRGRLYLSYSYRSDAGLYYDFMPGYYHFRAVLLSADGGRSWHLASTEDFIEGVDASAPDGPAKPGRLAGQVSAQDGSPVEGAVVVAGLAQAVTDRQGRFVLEPIYANPVDLVVRRAGYHTWQQTYTFSDTSEGDVVVTLVKALEIPVENQETWDRALKIGVRLEGEGPVRRLVFTDAAAGVFVLRAPSEETEAPYRAVRFEVRVQSPMRRVVELLVSAGNSRVRPLVSNEWQEVELMVSDGFDRLSIGLEQGKGIVLEIKNVVFVR